jgi:hypothetical protein
VGVVDVRAIVGTLVGEGTATNADIYKALSPSMTPMTDVCRAEFKGLAEKAPRLVFGNQSLTPTEARVAFTLELEPALAKMLQGLRAAVPGLSAKTDPSTFFQLGVGLDVDRAITLAQERAAAVTAAPFQCEQLAGLNEVAAEVTRSLAMATAGPAAMVRLVRGFSLVVKDLVPPAAQGSAGAPPLGVSGAKAYAALATSNPEGVLATIKAGLTIPVHADAAQAIVAKRPSGPGRFDTLVVRAVAPLGKLLGWFEPIAGSYGRLLVVKGPRWEEERDDARFRGLTRRVTIRRLASWPIRGRDHESVLLEIGPRAA